MANAKWYYLCNISENKAIDLLQIPAVWRNISGMSDLADDALASLPAWSGNPNYVFLTPEATQVRGIDQISINTVLARCLPVVTNWVRSMRDLLLNASDVVTVSDRWIAYDVVQRRNLTAYRQALRDIPSQDPFNVVWPAIPVELNFLRSISYDSIERPSEAFKAHLVTPLPPLTPAQNRADQWLRIHDERETRKAGGLKLNVGGTDYWFWTDEATRNQYALLAGRAQRNNLPADYLLAQWKTMSGAYVPFTVSLLHQVIDKGIDNESVLFTIAENHRQSMLQSSTPESYNYKTGWPPTYKESVSL